MAEEIRSSQPPASQPGPFLAKVISHLDPNYMGGLQVEILRPVGNESGAEGNLVQVKYMSPFAGQTSVDFINENNDYNGTQKSYGMWFVPPDVGATVMVIFIDGDPKRGYWIGCVSDNDQNFMVPGVAATKYNVEGTYTRSPVAEYNKKLSGASELDSTKVKKPQHPLAEKLATQGLINDDIRGITTSSARRETPSSVFGISTPGPIDKRSGATKGKVGKLDYQVDTFVSRLGGTTFVMDDGDDKFLRKKSASEAAPEYASVANGETTGQPDIPHNELFRIRTRTGHQILMHNSEDLIYIGNARGTSWIELSSNGKIDIYAEDSISVHTKQDINFRADRDINLEAGRNINIKAAGDGAYSSTGGRIQVESKKNYNLIVGADNIIRVTGKHNTTSGGLFQVKASGTNIDGGQIHFNSSKFSGDTTSTLPPLPKHILPDEKNTALSYQSIMKRVPMHEPWPHHENLDPTKFTPTKLDREVTTKIETPTAWKQYSTVTDTFEKIRPPESEKPPGNATPFGNRKGR
jgi:hypothetical protein